MSQTIILKHSTVKDKLPSSAQYGEVFVNYHSENPFLATLNNQGQFEKFLSENKLNELYYNKSQVNDIVANLESGGTIDFDDYYKKNEVDTLLQGKSDTGHTHSYTALTDLPDLSIYLTEHQDISYLATKQELESYQSISGMSSYLTVSQAEQDFQPKGDYVAPSDLEDYQMKSGMTSYLTIAQAEQDLQPKGDYALKSELPDTSNFITSGFTEDHYQPKGNYLTEHQSLENYYTKSEADNKFLTSHQDLSDYALKSEIPDVSNFVTSAFTEEHYMKIGSTPTDVYTKSESDSKFQPQSGMTDYALKSELPSTTGLASEEWVSNNFSSTAHTHSDLATKAELENYLTIVSASTTYATKSEIPDISDLATKSEIPDTSNFITSAFTEDHYQPKGTYVVPSDLNDYALKSELPSLDGLATEAELANYQPQSAMTEYVTDSELNTALQGKSNTGHTHSYNDLTDKPTIPTTDNLATKAELVNYQPVSGMSDYVTDSELNTTLEGYSTTAHTHSEYAEKTDLANYMPNSGMTDYALKSEIPNSYTKAETDTLLAGKANSAHTHTMSEITDLDVAKTWTGTLSEYNNLTEIDNDTLYIITDSSEQLVTSGDVESMISGYTNLTEVQTLLEGYSTTAHTHDYSEIQNTPDLSGFASLSDIPDTSNFITSAFTEEHYMKIGSTPTDVYTKAESDSKFQAISAMTEYSQTGHTHDYETLTNKPDLSIYLTEHQDISGLATKQELENYMPNSGMTDYVTDSELNTALEGYSQTGHTHSQYLTQTSADSRYARVVSCTQAEYDALVQNDQVEQGVLYCITESN
jgi:hypothetical protein